MTMDHGHAHGPRPRGRATGMTTDHGARAWAQTRARTPPLPPRRPPARPEDPEAETRIEPTAAPFRKRLRGPEAPAGPGEQPTAARSPATSLPPVQPEMNGTLRMGFEPRTCPAPETRVGSPSSVGSAGHPGSAGILARARFGVAKPPRPGTAGRGAGADWRPCSSEARAGRMPALPGRGHSPPELRTRSQESEMSPPPDYLRDPDEIYRRSFADRPRGDRPRSPPGVTSTTSRCASCTPAACPTSSPTSTGAGTR